MGIYSINNALDTALENVYLIYYYRGEMKVKEGSLKINGIFEPYDNPKKYHTKLHDFPLKLRYGKVWCMSDKDVPKAIEMIKQSRQRYVSEVFERYEKLKGAM